MTYQSNNNAVLYAECEPLLNTSVLLEVTEDLETTDGSGFSFQLNAYPPAGQLSQGQTLEIFQYIIYVLNDQIWYEIQYWAAGSTWPQGYVPDPGTTPWLPVLPNDYYLTSFGSVPGNKIPRESTLQISLTTDGHANVTGATFSYTDPDDNVSSATFDFPERAQYPIVAFELDLVGPGGGSNCTFTSGLTASRGIIYYSVSPGTLFVQNGGPGAACGEWGGGTAETSNAVYSDVSPASGSTVTQTLGQPVDCAVNHLARARLGAEAPATTKHMRHLRDIKVARTRSGQWLAETLERHAAELAGLLDQDPALARESWSLLEKARAASDSGELISADLVDAAQELVRRASRTATPALAAAATPLGVVLDALRGRTLEEGLAKASQTIHPRTTVPAQRTGQVRLPPDEAF
ncbi:hypothetical protein ABH920_009950 [Catenulispora sp. EB89]|uniref:hypothetical protein n=1 Tax=Catenulispora sp. EB89 TaxID=3156257 RepID=UPI003517C9F9